MKKSHIESILDEKFNVDDKLAKMVDDLFDIDSESKRILSTISKYGQNNDTAIAKLNHHSPNRDAVVRRTIGRKKRRFGKTMKNREFIFHDKGRKFNTGTEENLYTLTLKGFIASLSKNKFKDSYLTKSFYYMLTNDDSENKKLAELSLLLIKYNIAMFLSWHKINQCDLTETQAFNNLFLKWNEGNSNLKIDYGKFFSYDIEQLHKFEDIRKRFFALESIVAFLLRKQSKPTECLSCWYDENNEPQIIGPFMFNDLLKYWPYYIDKIQFIDFDLTHPNPQSWDYAGENIKEVTELRQKLANNLELAELPDIGRQKMIW